MEIFCRVPTLNLDAGSELPAINRDDLSRDSQLKSLEKKLPTSSLLKSLYNNKFPHDPRIRKLIYFKIFSVLFIYYIFVILLKDAR